MLRPVRTLAELRVGGSGVIADVTGGDAMAIRLLEMGLVPGTPVKLLKMAPMGDPMQLQVRGYHLSLRKAEAARVRLAGSAG
jgi:ferrous iron transport protein A